MFAKKKVCSEASLAVNEFLVLSVFLHIDSTCYNNGLFLIVPLIQIYFAQMVSVGVDLVVLEIG